MKNRTTAYYLVSTKELSQMIKIIRRSMIILILICGFGGSSFSQDIITLKTGKEIKVNIIAEDAGMIRYREYDNPAGPLYTVSKEKVASVKYKKGNREALETKVEEGGKVKPAEEGKQIQNDSFQPLMLRGRFVTLNGQPQSARQVKTIMEDNPEALRLYESGTQLRKLGNSCTYIIMINSFIGSQIVNKKETSDEKIRTGVPFLIVDGGVLVAAIIMGTMGRSKTRTSVELYNSSSYKPVTYRLNLGLQRHGIGLALTF
jgi:hypothetical protein